MHHGASNRGCDGSEIGLLMARLTALCFSMALIAPAGISVAGPEQSPFGSDDEVGMLNVLTPEMTRSVLQQVSSGKVYDLSHEFFVGMPGPDYHRFGQPAYMYFRPTDPAVQQEFLKDLLPEGSEAAGVTTTEDAFMMTCHHGTQFDAFSHIHLNGEIFNGFKVAEHDTPYGMNRGGMENVPPVITRGVLIDVAAAKGMDVLPNSYPITIDDLKQALERQRTRLKEGDVVLVRTGWGRYWPDPEKMFEDNAGITVESAGWLVDQGAVLIGSDNTSVERTPFDSQTVHVFLLVKRGVNMMEQMQLETLSHDKVYEFAFIVAPLKLRGAAGSPIRPLAVPIDSDD